MTEMWQKMERHSGFLGYEYDVYARTLTLQRIIKGDGSKHHKEGSCRISKILDSEESAGQADGRMGKREKQGNKMSKLKCNIRLLKQQKGTNNLKRLLEIGKAQLNSTKQHLNK